MRSTAIRLLILLAGSTVSLAVPGAAGAAMPAQEQEQRDYEFAQALVDRGWAVVAEPLIERSLASSSVKDKDRFQILRGMLYLQVARRTLQPGPRADAFKDALKVVDDLVKVDLKVMTEGMAGQNLGEFFVEGARLIADEAHKETDKDQAKALMQRAEKMIDTAEKIFLERRDKARAVSAQAGASGEEEDGEEKDEGDGSTRATRDEMNAAFNLANTKVQKGMILGDGPEEKAKRETAFKSAIGELEDFQATYSGTPLAYKAAILSGQCYNALGDYRQAMGTFDGVTSLINEFRDPANPNAPVVVDNPMAAEFIQQALYLKAQAANRPELRKHDDAFAAVVLALNLFPEIRRRPMGYLLRIEGARAQMKAGRADDARKKLEEVVQDDPEGPYGAEARNQLGELLSVGTGAIQGDLGEAMRSFFDRGDYPRVIQVARQLLVRFDGSGEKERAENVPSISLWLGRAYASLRRNQEAAIAFEEIIERFPRFNDAPEAAFQAVRSRLFANASTPTAYDQAKYESNLKILTDRYKESPQAGAGEYLKADAALEAGEYVAAAKAYLAVPETAGQLHDNAIFQAGLCSWNQGLRAQTIKVAKPSYDEAEKLFLQVVELASKDQTGVDRERLQNRMKLRLSARVKLAEIYCSTVLKKYKEAQAVIDACDREDRPDGEQAALLAHSRVRTLAALGEVEKSEEALAVVRQKAPNSRLLPQLCREIARAYDNKAAAAEKKGGAESQKEYKALISKAIEYYALWVEDSERLKMEVDGKILTGKNGIAQRSLAIALEVTGLPSGKDSFSDCIGKTDIPRAEWTRAVKLLELANAQDAKLSGGKKDKARDWLPVATLGRAYGFMGDWKKAKDLLEESLVWGGFLKTTGQAIPKPEFTVMEKIPDMMDIYIDLGFAELIPARKGGLARAKAIFNSAFPKTQRETCGFWKCRYGVIDAELRDGDYQKADGLLKVWKGAFPDWDKGECGLKDQFEALRRDLDAKLPGSDAGTKKNGKGAKEAKDSKDGKAAGEAPPAEESEK